LKLELRWGQSQRNIGTFPMWRDTSRGGERKLGRRNGRQRSICANCWSTKKSGRKSHLSKRADRDGLKRKESSNEKATECNDGGGQQPHRDKSRQKDRNLIVRKNKNPREHQNRRRGKEMLSGPKEESPTRRCAVKEKRRGKNEWQQKKGYPEREMHRPL